LAGLVALVAVLSGCAGEDGALNSSQGPAGTVTDPAGGTYAPGDEPAATAGVGTVKGSVTDDNLLPLEGVRITLQSPSRETTTDASGKFDLGTMAAGTRRVTANLSGFDDVSRAFEVVADKEITIKLVMVQRPSGESFVKVDEHAGTVTYAVVSRTLVGLGGSSSGGTSHTFFMPDLPSALTNAHSEVVWEATTAADAGLSYSLYVTGASTKNLCRASGKAPVQTCTSNDNITKALQSGWICSPGNGTDACRLSWSVATAFFTNTGVVDVGLSLNQNFKVYVSMFYGQEMPDGYKVRP
jgi:hypothetical protein